MKVKDLVSLSLKRRVQPSVTVPQNLFDWSLTIVATGGFSGYSAIVPGTVGSLVGLLLYLPLTECAFLVRVVATTGLFILGVVASTRMEAIWRIKDPNPVVIDEIVGMWIALLFVPHDVASFVAAFLLFRLFDVIKPFPARQAELLQSGWGIMSDDVFAGIYAGAAVYGFVAVRPLPASQI